MKSCFGFMFWGVLLVALDFKFKDFDSVPHFVGGMGYALVAIGAGGLAPMTGNLVAATATGWLLVVLYCVAPFIPFSSGDERLFEILIAVLDAATIWTTLAGVGDIAVGRNRPVLAKRAVPLRTAYALLVAVALVTGLTFQGSASAERWLTVIVAAATVVVVGLILHLLYRAWRELIR
jgi:hypothetical protein